ncbi:HD domain-containing protein [Antarcticibacterium sp. 1MA-6-2]|uniref:HD domain-containing protein n=1 Tax=Antarcticibacterium sp. 1MA-6-2 TaxID=2908210 RepID=UPI001F229A6B|nr:HD domain-containing protein [Antarcticibacterium sp. 1MA-6-2]UJH91543.1 HD domain-containing protein [Antarcticibacterium sp. 1MA-6-2]
MAIKTKLKIFNDPIYGFITIPSEGVFNIIAHPYFQRLRRISQMGMSYLVYPGAHHTRFHHALGSLHLMQKTVDLLRFKGINISGEEEEGLYIAILMHDIGHGPFSHAMEHTIVEGVSHECISLLFMEEMNKDFNQSLTLGIEIFKGTYHRKFMNELVSSQLDMDRLDYLKRDSFYTGVPEGNINSERIITMLNVLDDQLVVEEKGIYSVEKFLVARRLMYWQVYLHKTGVAAEQLLIRILKRAKELIESGESLHCSPSFSYFLNNRIRKEDFDAEVLQRFSKLDDYDIISAMKQWTDHHDFVLRNLSSMLLNRDLLKVKLKKKPIDLQKLTKHKNNLQKKYQISEAEASYFVFHGEISNVAYSTDAKKIKILHPNGKTSDVTKASDQLNLKALSRPVTKYYICYPKPKD